MRPQLVLGEKGCDPPHHPLCSLNFWRGSWHDEMMLRSQLLEFVIPDESGRTPTLERVPPDSDDESNDDDDSDDDDDKVG